MGQCTVTSRSAYELAWSQKGLIQINPISTENGLNQKHIPRNSFHIDLLLVQSDLQTKRIDSGSNLSGPGRTFPSPRSRLQIRVMLTMQKCRDVPGFLSVTVDTPSVFAPHVTS